MISWFEVWRGYLNNFTLALCVDEKKTASHDYEEEREVKIRTHLDIHRSQLVLK